MHCLTRVGSLKAESTGAGCTLHEQTSQLLSPDILLRSIERFYKSELKVTINLLGSDLQITGPNTCSLTFFEYL